MSVYHKQSIRVLSVLLVTDIIRLSRIEGKVADRSNESVNSKSNGGKNEVEPGSGSVTLRLKRGAVNDDASYPAKEERKKETSDFVVFHSRSP